MIKFENCATLDLQNCKTCPSYTVQFTYMFQAVIEIYIFICAPNMAMYNVHTRLSKSLHEYDVKYTS